MEQPRFADNTEAVTFLCEVEELIGSSEGSKRR
jgi:hypothetical protein